jgi:hypothetical protein
VKKPNELMRKKPQPFYIPIDRRRFFKSMAVASAGFTLSGYLAEALTQSPIVTQGPYYPLADDIPLEEAKAAKGFYKVTFRVPGANTGTP